MVGLHGERRKTEREKSFCLYVSHHRPTTEREEIFFLIIIIIIIKYRGGGVCLIRIIEGCHNE
jgi:hypothetical protein